MSNNLIFTINKIVLMKLIDQKLNANFQYSDLLKMHVDRKLAWLNCLDPWKYRGLIMIIAESHDTYSNISLLNILIFSIYLATTHIDVGTYISESYSVRCICSSIVFPVLHIVSAWIVIKRCLYWVSLHNPDTLWDRSFSSAGIVYMRHQNSHNCACKWPST